MLSSTFTTKISYNKYMIRILVVIILLLLVVPGCKEDNRPLIPYVYVSLSLYPNTMDYINTMGYKYVNAGYRGIVVFRIAQDQFMVR